MFARLVLRGRHGCMARPRLPTLARHYSEAAAAAHVAIEPGETQISRGTPKAKAPLPRDLTLIQHILGFYPDQRPPEELSSAFRLKDSAMLDVLIVAFDVESSMRTHEWTPTNRGGALIGVSILDTRDLTRELGRGTTPKTGGLNKAIRPLQFHVLSERPECREYISRQAPKFTWGKSVETSAEDVPTKLHKLLVGRDVVSVFHNRRLDDLYLRCFGFNTTERALLSLDTHYMYGRPRMLNSQDSPNGVFLIPRVIELEISSWLTV